MKPEYAIAGLSAVLFTWATSMLYGTSLTTLLGPLLGGMVVSCLTLPLLAVVAIEVARSPIRGACLVATLVMAGWLTSAALTGA